MSETDRFCRTCGQSQSGASAGRYEPGPSFIDDSALQVDPFELPPWLREMTTSASNGAEDHAASPASTMTQNDTLPPWLDAAPPVNGSGSMAANQDALGWSKPAARPNDESMAEFSLISEDDLPEWLRALGDQEFEAEPTPIVPQMNGAMPSVQAPTLVIPTISRAWLSRPRSVENETAEEVASDFVPIEASASAEPVRATAPTPNTSARTIDATESLPAAKVAEPVGAAAKSNPQYIRMLSLSALVVIVVIVVFFALSNLL